MGLQEIRCLDITSMMSELKNENASGNKAITAIDVSGALDAELIGSILKCTPVNELSKNFKFVSMCEILAPRFIAEICIDMLYFREDENKKAKFQFIKTQLETANNTNFTDTLLSISKHLLEKQEDATNDKLEFDNITENTAIITKGKYKQDKNQINILALNKLCKSVSTSYPQTLILLDPFNEIEFDLEKHKLIYRHASNFNMEVKVFNIEKNPHTNECKTCEEEMFKELIAPLVFEPLEQQEDQENLEDKAEHEIENDQNTYDSNLIP